MVRERWHQMVSPARKSEQKPEKESPLTGSLQICNFLNHMAFNADLDSIQVAQPRYKAAVGAGYDPMRRRLAVM